MAQFCALIKQNKMNCQAFITTPVLKSPQLSQTQKRPEVSLRQKIVSLLKSLNSEKQLLNQAINNINIPKHFVNIGYIETRPDQQLPQVWTAICSLRKQITKIKRYSDGTKAHNCADFKMLSHKLIQQTVNKTPLSAKQNRQFEFLNRQIQPQKRIKQAIERQLVYRQKLEKRRLKEELSQNLRSQMLQLKKQQAKSFNKKCVQLYEKQRQSQMTHFDTIKATQFNYQPSPKPSKSPSRTQTTRHQEHKQYAQKQQQAYIQQHFQQQERKSEIIRQFKHKRLNSMKERVLWNREKSEQIRERKMITEQRCEEERLQRLIEKQRKIIISREQKHLKDSKKTQSPASDPLYPNPSTLLTYQQHLDTKQSLILEKLQRSNHLRQLHLQQKVQQVKRKNQEEQDRINTFKSSQLKIFTEITNEDHNSSMSGQKQDKLMQSQRLNSADRQEENIRRKHQKALQNMSCEQTIMRLGKLPKSALQKKLKQIRNNELSNLLAKNIVNFLN